MAALVSPAPGREILRRRCGRKAPDRVARVAAVEPADVGWTLAEKRLRATNIPVEPEVLGRRLPRHRRISLRRAAVPPLVTMPVARFLAAEPSIADTSHASGRYSR